jgi:hypothetical protein
MASKSKTTIIKGTNVKGKATELVVPNDSNKITGSNSINSFNLPVQNPVSNFDSGGKVKKTKALNINRIKVETQLTGKVSDEFAAKLHNGNGDRPDLDNKEDWASELYNLFVSGRILDLESTNSDTNPELSEFSGFIHNIDLQEKAQSESSVYDVTIKFVDEVLLSS